MTPAKAIGERGSLEVRRRSKENSNEDVHVAALEAQPRSGLSWIDIGIGTGGLLREDRWEPSSLVGVDLLPWLEKDLETAIDLHIGDAANVLSQLPLARPRRRTDSRARRQ